MSLEIVLPLPMDNTSEATVAVAARLAPRPPRSSPAEEGALIGLVDNGKHNAGKLLQELGGMLASRGLASGETMHTKPSASRPMVEEKRDRMAARSRLVLTGVGD